MQEAVIANYDLCVLNSNLFFDFCYLEIVIWNSVLNHFHMNIHAYRNQQNSRKHQHDDDDIPMIFYQPIHPF